MGMTIGPSRSDQSTVPRLLSVYHGSSRRRQLRSRKDNREQHDQLHTAGNLKNEQSSVLKLEF